MSIKNPHVMANLCRIDYGRFQMVKLWVEPEDMDIFMIYDNLIWKIYP